MRNLLGHLHRSLGAIIVFLAWAFLFVRWDRLMKCTDGAPEFCGVSLPASRPLRSAATTHAAPPCAAAGVIRQD